MDYEDYENMDDLSITKVDTYQQFLDKFITQEDKMYLEDEDLIRDVKHFHAVNKGKIYITAR
jgi:hypothetical protein